MDSLDNDKLDSLLSELDDGVQDITPEDTPPAAPQRALTQLMRKIPVTLTLEVGAARVSLQELMAIREDSVVELDTLAGEPLVIKVNGTTIGRAEVVVSGENYGLKVVELSDMDLGSLSA
ncbi:MAG: flagellar motor switch protein FliN [Candidatus Dactylopiibacterium carminicum]|uniref:Flagellar motor switch protein FliN n=1 Tax=Candidatus Dactylopiibacterium carminicum TaxID=857335 RepID=A0A272EWF1_9RHOO|nr:FliM/FliN family flagellar motor switch protein [Candidatus Dactylopiibacterium carminicum]KAF7599975.1 flagellar motor switch protein FliN [Candidatus Dactylopiibacterium carminicum]PAS94444.1 MAG: flagellar motor switch protein FliN [Candidatus Dactylopiibacterium carminicum]PAS96396.1 MAG: flagellar motor switch protein FliN [Candidatus Dactylopiibacterium carminicum]PAS99977.1 MAG: flagellar motor switch protein FliN [Candidatus Dactylopiibacterium carminicum]